MSLPALRERGRRPLAHRLPLFLIGCLLASVFLAAPARAVVSLRLNSAGVITAPTTLTVDGIATSLGDWHDLKAAQVCITYDPTKVTLSNAQAATGWSLQIAEDHTTEHIYQAIFTTNTEQVSTTGPIYALDPDDVSQLADLAGNPNPIAFSSGDIFASPEPNPVNGGVLVYTNVYSADGTNGSHFDAYLYCKSSTTGLDLWQNPVLVYSMDSDDFPANAPRAQSSPAVGQGNAYVTTADAWASARNLATGAPVWTPTDIVLAGVGQNNYDMSSYGSPTLFNGRVYGTYTEDEFHRSRTASRAAPRSSLETTPARSGESAAREAQLLAVHSLLGTTDPAGMATTKCRTTPADTLSRSAVHR